MYIFQTSQRKNEANDILSQPFILIQICEYLFMLSFILKQYLHGMSRSD